MKVSFSFIPLNIHITYCAMFRVAKLLKITCCLIVLLLFQVERIFSVSSNLMSKFVYMQVYDMQFELNEVEARREQYPSTISFLNLINALIAGEKDVNDRGRR